MYIYTIYIYIYTYIRYIIHHSHELKFWGWKQGSKTIRNSSTEWAPTKIQKKHFQVMGTSSPKFLVKQFSCSQSFRGGTSWVEIFASPGPQPMTKCNVFLHQDLIILSCTPKTGSSNLKLCTSEEILDLEIVMFQVPCFVSKGMCMSQFPSSCYDF